MQHINSVLQSSQSQIATTKQCGNISQKTQTLEAMTKTWRTLQAWKLVHSEVGSTEFKAWQAALKDLGDMELRNGLTRAQNFTGYFSLPAFRELCKNIDAQAIGLPDVKKAYIEACRAPSPKAKFNWSHPAVYHAGVATGWHELSCFAEDQIYPRFKTFYAGFCERVAKGESLDSPMQEALPQGVTVFLSPEENQGRMAALREATGL